MSPFSSSGTSSLPGSGNSEQNPANNTTGIPTLGALRTEPSPRKWEENTQLSLGGWGDHWSKKSGWGGRNARSRDHLRQRTRQTIRVRPSQPQITAWWEFQQKDAERWRAPDLQLPSRHLCASSSCSPLYQLTAVPGSVALKLRCGGNAIPESKYDRLPHFSTFKQ